MILRSLSVKFGMPVQLPWFEIPVHDFLTTLTQPHKTYKLLASWTYRIYKLILRFNVSISTFDEYILHFTSDNYYNIQIARISTFLVFQLPSQVFLNLNKSSKQQQVRTTLFVALVGYKAYYRNQQLWFGHMILYDLKWSTWRPLWDWISPLLSERKTFVILFCYCKEMPRLPASFSK